MRHAPKLIKLVFLGIHDLRLIDFVTALLTNLLALKLLIFLASKHSFYQTKSPGMCSRRTLFQSTALKSSWYCLRNATILFLTIIEIFHELREVVRAITINRSCSPYWSLIYPNWSCCYILSTSTMR